MQSFIKKYLTGIGFSLAVLIVASTISNISPFDIGNQSATVASLKTENNASPASGFAWNDNVGWINFGGESSNEEGRVYISRNKLYGYAWGENIGWISLNCENDGNCTNSYGVTQNNGNGTLTGKAWGENIGWIDFAPTGGGVTLTKECSGVNTLSGYAWGENIGWISFSGNNYGVTTTWTRACGSSTQTPACIYDDPAWGVCSATTSLQYRTLTATNQTCAGENTKIEEQACTPIPVSASTTPISISITPTSTTTNTGSVIKLTATVTGTTTNMLADWTVTPIETIVDNFYGEVSPLSGTSTYYTAPAHAVNVTIMARAQADTSKTATANIIVRLATTTATTTIPVATTTATSTESVATTTITEEDILPPTVPVAEENNKSLVDVVTNFFTPDDSDAPTTDTSGHGGGGSTSDESIPDIINISKFVFDNVAVLGTTTEKIIIGAQRVLESKTGDVVAKTITTAGVVGGGVAATSVIAINGTIAADLFFLPFRLWGLLLSALGLKKRKYPWGTVYDSVTKQPIDPAYVTLKNLVTGAESTSITDLDGRYGFLVAPGKYTITANKTNYTFPSQKLLGKTEDTLYSNLYLGGELNIDTANALISKNIPMDPVKFDWNEFVKGKKKLMKFYSKREKLTRIITDWIFRIGFVVSLVSLFLVSAPYNYIIFGLYLVLAILRKLGLRQKALGSLTDQGGDPLSFAIVRVFSSELNVEITNKVADQIGRYYCLLPKGEYYVKIEKKNDDESYSLVYTSEKMNADNGIINSDFVI
jgi:hypothetical protein